MRWGTIVLNGILITSAPIEGAHYLIDIIAGAIIAPIVIVAAVAIARRIGQASVRNLPLPPEPAFADPPSGATPAAEPTAS